MQHTGFTAAFIASRHPWWREEWEAEFDQTRRFEDMSTHVLLWAKSPDRTLLSIGPRMLDEDAAYDEFDRTVWHERGELARCGYRIRADEYIDPRGFEQKAGDAAYHLAQLASIELRQLEALKLYL